MRTLASILLRIVTSRRIQRLLPALIIACLMTWFWTDLLRALGAGVALPILAAVLLLWVMSRRRIPAAARAWNRWLGAVTLAAALLGLLAFFNPGDGILNDVSLGGNWGSAIIGSQSYTGVLSVVAIALVGIAVTWPALSWRALRNGARRVIPALRQSGRWGQTSQRRLRDFYRQHPLHANATSWVRQRRQRGRAFREIVMPPPQPPPDPPIARQPVTVEKDTSPSAAPAGSIPATPQLALPFLGRWQLPSVELLNETAKANLSQAEVERRARLIEESLGSYGVEAKVVQINVGPTVTQFGIDPGWDRKFKEVKQRDRDGNVNVRLEEVSRTRVKVERITSLSNNLALALAAHSIRIEAPIPGTSLVGIEVPNSSMGLVPIRDVLESGSFQKLRSRSKMAIALGEGTAGEMVAADLAKMPHVLIAGATGSGKTVCLDSIIVSLLTNNTPEELRFIMVDPKRVELIAFNGMPHLMTPVVTEGDKAVDMLKWIEQDMDNRYRKLASAGAHNIERYNRSSQASKPMHYLVVIIDELADLMMVKSEEVEPRLCRSAQMGRAVGIHLVIATQRPSVDVITGLIKANFPTRISFGVVSQVDSRTILDMAGAEKLLGRGDMLYLSSDMSKPKRLQGCYTSPEEIDRVVNFWREQARMQTAGIFASADDDIGKGNGEDPLLDQARRLAKEHRQISPSFLQRQLRVGYARAERLMQQLQKEAVDTRSQAEES